ncbi:MAG: hypothetical protein KDD44_11095 [Bdellovibrionales bacterium]|nr:hypothetical protein [Bdellovibrionales bacterium]
MANNVDDGGWMRWLVIGYAAGIVLIAYHSLEEKYGNLWDYLERSSVASALEWTKDMRTDRVLRHRRTLDGTPETKVLDPATGEDEQGEAAYDHLTANDRRALSSLINDLE